MEIEQVADLARTVAALPQDERDFFDGMVADERAKAADAKRIADLRAMGGYTVVRMILCECAEHAASYDTATALRRIEEAGFVRNHDDPAQPFTHTQAEVDKIVRLSNEITKGRIAEFIGPGGYIEQAYRAGFEASSEGFNFEILGDAYAGDADFESRLARDFELLLANFEEGASA